MKTNIFFHKLWLFVCLLAISISAGAQTTKKNIYVYKGDSVVYKAKVSLVDSVAIEENKTVVSIYSKDGTKLYSAPYSDIDSITYSMKTPVADMFDIRFTEDGTAYDASDAQLGVNYYSDADTLDVHWNDVYQTYECHFANTWAGTPTSYCKADYSQNDYFKEQLQNGHSFETIFKASYDPPIQNAEAKWFCMHQSGGTGFLICKTNSSGRKNEITFLPYTGGSYRWANSGVVPQPDVYYHVVGVYNKEEEKAYIYVNGELKNVIDAPGDFKYPTAEAAQWIGVGCDANSSNGDQSGDWTVVKACIYSKPLSQYEAEALWEEVEALEQTPVADILDVQFQKDGTAIDISPLQNTVEAISPSDTVPTYLNGNFNCYAAKIKNDWGTGGSLGDNPTYFKVNFADNQTFKDALADGHTIETVFKATYTAPITNAEAKWFAAHQAGGTGFLISKTNTSGRQNEITFLPNVTTTGKSNWIWATSGVVPEPETYYHVVGVWNKEEGKAYIYVNGELKNTVDAEGELKFPSSGANWFGIGCDANTSNGENGGNWEIVRARIYDDPLTKHNVATLWNEIASQISAADDSVKNAIEEENIPDVEAPTATLLDVVFNADGTAEDVSPMKNTVQTIAGDGLSTYYSNTYKRYVARFDNPWAGTATGYYHIDYADNQAFIDSLKNGHSLEAIFMADYETLPASEVKFFSSHASGGTGFLLSTSNELNFLPYTGGSYRWANSTLIPTAQQYYHVIGVWNKEESMAYVYVNGELCGTVSASGDLKLPTSGQQWFGIGGDPAGANAANTAWTGDVVLARAYGHPLSKAEVKALWKQVSEQQESAVQLVSNVSYYNNLQVTSGSTFSITGKGFKEGDKIVLTSLSSEGSTITVDATPTDDGATIQIPAELTTGKYLFSVMRGEQIQDIKPITFNVVETLSGGSKVIAHRGYWNVTGSAQNSVSAVKNAIANNYYGAEIDVWITTDGHLMVNHDATLNGVEIQNSTYDEVKDLKLSNGETIPELKDILALFTDDVTTKLIIEIKTHTDSTRGAAAAQGAFEAVYEAFAYEKVEYIAFSLDICKQLVDLDNSNIVSYLNGDKTPAELNELGIKGLDYTLAKYTNNPTWVQEAKELGMITNVWTLDSSSDIIKANNMGIDFITTNYPVEAEKIRQLYTSSEEE